MKIDNNFINNSYLQHCGDNLFIVEKTNQKKNREYLWKGIFQKYPYEIFAKKGDILKGIILNPRIEEEEFLKKEWLQNCGDILTILGKTENFNQSKKYRCKFINYPCEVETYKCSILKGAVLNPNIEQSNFIGKEYLQHCGDLLVILKKSDIKDKYNHHFLYKCKFLKYPCIVYCQKTDLIRGKVDNPSLPWRDKKKLRKCIKENFKEKPTLEKLASFLNLSISYTCQKIREFDLKEYILYQDASKGENEIRDYCRSINNSFLKTSSWNELDGKEIDIYSPKLKLGIEYNGDYWHSDEIVFKTYGVSSKERDLLKYNLAKSKGINLYFIWEHDWKNRPEVVKRYLKFLINKYNKI